MGSFERDYPIVNRTGGFDRNRIISDVSVITEPSIEPVTLGELKSEIGISHSNDDAQLNAYITSARVWCEKYLNTYIMTQIVEITMDQWPGWEFGLGLWPIQSVDSVKYDDTASPIAEQTLTANTNYYADITAKCGRIQLIDSMPSVTTRPNAIKIRATVGYVEVSSSPVDLRSGVPEPIKTGIKMYAKGLYESDPCSKVAAREIIHFLQVKCGGL